MVYLGLTGNSSSFRLTSKIKPFDCGSLVRGDIASGFLSCCSLPCWSQQLQQGQEFGVCLCKHAGGQPELDSAQGWRQPGLLICSMLVDLFPAERLRQTA